MKIAGIISEYNPFHNGHLHQITLLREQGFDYVIVLMSGDFVQRGAPAVVDKFTRARMALLSGADLVLELPSLFAVSSAELFAGAGVRLLGALCCVDTLCFGCEDPDSALLSRLAATLGKETTAFQRTLSQSLKSGLSYPAARARALSNEVPEAKPFLQKPNNILALEYVRAIHRYRLPLSFLPIQRTDPGYHALRSESTGAFRSAEGIRERLFLNEDVSESVPESTLSLLQEASSRNALLRSDDMSSFLFYRLLSEEDFSVYADCSEALSRKLLKFREEADSFSSLMALLKTRDLTYTRISRVLTNILLGRKKEELTHYRDLSAVSSLYARVLGFRKAASPLLSELKKSTSIPLISKVADAPDLLNPEALKLFRMDIHASKVYNLLCLTKTGIRPMNDYLHPMEIIP